MPVGDDENPWIGKVVGGRFRVTRILGEGGMGVVYAGEQQMGSTIRQVAIKTLHKHLSSDPSVLARFHRECGTVAQLEHPNTIKVYDFGAEDDGTLYIAMEFVDGRSLDKVIEEDGPMEPERVVEIMRQVCGALDEAHEQGIIHRDLKPENVVLTERLGQKDFVKVLDFGIAARSESASAESEQKLTQQGMVLGTPPYMSPEQFTGQALDRRSDIYSLGIMAYEMLTARLPFSASTAWQWATEHMTAQPFPIDQAPSKSGIPIAVREAVMRALSKDPAARQETAGAFLQGLEAGVGRAAAASAPDRSSSGTEAMDAVPSFGSAPSVGKTEVQPARAPGPLQHQATPAAMAAPPAPPRAAAKGGKGLIFGLGGVALVLLGAIAFVAVGSGGGDTPPAPPSFGEEGSPKDGPTTAIGPEVDGATPDPGEGVVPDPDATPDKPTTSTPKSTSEPPKTTPQPKPTATSAPTPAPTATSKPDPAPAADDKCTACVSAANAGNLPGAAAAYSKCSSAGQTQCKAVARRAAASAAAAAAKAGDCQQAQAISAAAQTMGVATKRVLDAAANCGK